MKTKYINVFGGPGIGKSTAAADIFVKMKKLRYDVELVTEVAKDFVWENRSATLQIQPYVTFKQYRNLIRLQGQVEFVVTDAPVLLGAIYCELYNGPSWMRDAVIAAHRELSPCYNLQLERQHKYQENGRIQTEGEAVKVDQMIDELLTGVDLTRTYNKAELYFNLGIPE